MGLDMYFTKKVFFGAYDEEKRAICPEFKERPTVSFQGLCFGNEEKTEVVIDLNEVESMDLKVAYWRKANAIHKWFVDHCANGEDNCEPMTVHWEQMKELVETCEKVLADHSLAKELLPTQDGFFFGDTEYDEWYFNDLEYTVQKLKPYTTEEGCRIPGAWVDFEYKASW